MTHLELIRAAKTELAELACQLEELPDEEIHATNGLTNRISELCSRIRYRQMLVLDARR